MRHRWALVLCAALAVAALAVTLDALRGLRYTAESLVRVQDLGEAGANGADGASERRLAEVRAAAGAEEVARDAMQEIGWERDIQEFDQRLEVEAAGDGRLGVEFSANDPERAADGANAYASSFVTRVEGLAGDRLAGGALNADAEVVRKAQPPPAPSRARLVLVGLAALVPGVAVGGALAVALGGRDRRLRDARDAELTLGAPVLGVIPDYGAGEPESEEEDVVRRR